MKHLAIALLCLLFCLPAFGQSTNLTVNTTDTDSQPWFGGTYQISFKPAASNPTGPYYWNGVPFNIYSSYSGITNGSGAFTQSLPSNTSITPSGSVWTIQVCPGATASCYTLNSTITGSTQTLNLTPPGIRINLVNPPANVSIVAAYQNLELVGGTLGQQYYNLTTTYVNYCQVVPCGWTQLSAGTGGSQFPVTTLPTSASIVLTTAPNTNFSYFTVLGLSATVSVSGTPSNGVVLRLDTQESNAGGIGVTFPANFLFPPGWTLNTAGNVHNRMAWVYDGTNWQPFQDFGGSGSGGGGSSAPNYGISFTGQTTVTIPASSSLTTTKNVIAVCYDNGSPNANQIIPGNVQVNNSTLAVTINFLTAQSGYCVLNLGGGSGGGGGGSSFYQTLQSNGSQLTQRPTFNVIPPMVAVDNSGATRSDISTPPFVAAGSSHAAGLVPDPGASASPILPLCNNGTFSSACGGGGTQPNTVYVSTGGNDTNTCVSWAAACLTVFGALEKLSGGTSSPAQAGSGLVYVSEGVSANPTANAGIWFLYTADPNYASPPAGWLRGPAGSLQIMGVGCKTNPSNGSGSNVCYIAGGSSSNPAQPALAVNGTTAMRFENLAFYAAKAMSGAIDSTGSRINSTLVNFVAYNVDFVTTNVVGGGPTVDIGANSFNNYWDHISGGATPANVSTIAAAPTGLSLTSNVLTVTTTASNSLVTGQKCSLVATADPTFSGSYGGSGITVLTSTTFTVPLAHANATSGSGYVVCDNAMMFVFDPSSGAIATAENHVVNSTFNTGGIRYWAGTSTGSLYVKDTYSEDSYTSLVTVGNASNSQVYVENGRSADGLSSEQYGVRNDTANPSQVGSSSNVYFIGAYGSSNCCYGQVSIFGDQYAATNANPLISNQRGVLNGRLYAQSDSAKASPQSVRFANQAVNASSWALNIPGNPGATLTTGVLDRDGGTAAVSASQTSGIQNGIVFNSGNSLSGTVGVGDWIICGVWVRSTAAFTPPTGAGYTGGGNPVACGPTGGSSSVGYLISNPPPNGGDNEWEWVWSAYKFTAVSGSPGVLFQALFGTSLPIVAYAPIMVRVPSGTISDGDVANFALNLRPYSNTCTVGMVCDWIGQSPHVNQIQTGWQPQGFASVGTLPTAATNTLYFGNLNNWPSFNTNGGTNYAMPAFTGAWTANLCPYATAVTYVFSLQACSGSTNNATQYSAAYYSLTGSNNTISGIPPPTTNGFWFYGYNVTASVAVQPNNYQPGIPVNPNGETTCATLSLAANNRATYLKCSGGAAVTVTLPQVASPNAANYPLIVQNLDSGSMTLQANAADKIDGSALGGTQTVLAGWCVHLYQDQSSAPGNWWTLRFPCFGSVTGNGSSVMSASGSFTTGHGLIVGATGNAVDSGAAPVNYPTATRAGDLIYWNGTLWTNFAGNNSGTQILSENSSGVPAWTAAGAGTVTCGTTCTSGDIAVFTSGTAIGNIGNSSAHTFVGNNTGSSATPATSTAIGAQDVSPNVCAAGGGTAQAQTVTLTPAVTSLVNGLQVCWKPTANNTGSGPTLAVNGLTATNIVKQNGNPLYANDISTTNYAYAVYDGTNFELINPQFNTAGALAELDQTGVSTANSGVAQNIIASIPATGFYSMNVYADQNAGCTTVGSASLSSVLTFTDATHARTLTQSPTIIPGTTSGATSWTTIGGPIGAWLTAGSAVTITLTYVACTTGTWTYDLHANVTRQF
jgi:hypothetical protein